VDGRWYCSVACVERMARNRLLEARPASRGLPAAGHLRIGVWLRPFGVTTKQIDEALDVQRTSRLRLGAQLVTLGYATSEMVLEALARQSGADFLTHVDAGVVRHAPGGLSSDAVRALCLVPITKPDRGRVRVACAAPVPRVALAAFSRITGLVPEPCVVTDATYESLVEAYGVDATRHETAEFFEASDLGDAIRHITAAAMHDGSSRVTETRLAPLTWVRVQSDTGVRDVVWHERPKEA
jgi:Type II secretion system (T2SS), protein E, N-terminal domain